MSKDPTHLYKAYHKASHTVSKTRQIVMLYDGTIRFLQQAGEAMEKNEFERRYNCLSRASEVISGLQGCLDFNAGGDMAKILFDFYSNIELRILTLHRTNDKASCDRVIADLKQMRDSWDKIDRTNEAPPTPDNTPPNIPPGTLTASA